MTYLHLDCFESRRRVCYQFLAQHAHALAPHYLAFPNPVEACFVSVD